MAMAADRLWQGMPERVGKTVGYRQAGIMFIVRTAEQMAVYENWQQSVKDYVPESRLLTPNEIAQQVPGGQGVWAGGIFTSSDGRAEPTLASSAIAQAAMAKGAVIVENCAVRSLSLAAGKVCGVVTEKGEIRCEQVLLAAGLWSRRFLGNMGINLPTLPVVCSVLRTQPMEGPTDIAVGAPDFSFRKHQDGGFIITQRGALDAPLTLDHTRIGLRYLPTLRSQRDALRIRLNRYFWQDLMLPRRWRNNRISPFERVRTMDPAPNPDLNNEALTNLRAAWPVFNQAKIEQAWAGMIDITPDTNPVIGAVDGVPGLTLATGFSGHGFGTSPAAGQLAADLVMNATPLVDPAPYRFDRFK
ncbi:NAD(P)/FAD-dependent oxidoreductase [Neisseria dentiae]|uniref:NAD(P)/FAD-dependent oxidoreductase n=1 Tax=Neisseria dentiae TaxID=194197 RepID=UPI0021752097|nr:FAD-binding oxidoreductase [Neisseria dentiae]